MRLSTLLPALICAPLALAAASGGVAARDNLAVRDANLQSIPAAAGMDKTKRQAVSMTTCPPQVNPSVTACPAGVPGAAFDTSGRIIDLSKTSKEHQKVGIGMTPVTLGPDPGSTTGAVAMVAIMVFFGGAMLMVSLRDEEDWDRQYSEE